MVVLAAAAIGAAGYGVYRGGDAAVRKTKETHKEVQRERVRKGQRSDLASKQKDRKQRMANLISLRNNNNNNNNNSNSNSNSNSTEQSWPGVAKSDTTANTNTNTNTNPTSNSSSCNSVDDRHQNVMTRLRESRSKDPSAKKGPGSRLKGMFSSSSSSRK